MFKRWSALIKLQRKHRWTSQVDLPSWHVGDSQTRSLCSRSSTGGFQEPLYDPVPRFRTSSAWKDGMPNRLFSLWTIKRYAVISIVFSVCEQIKNGQVGRLKRGHTCLCFRRAQSNPTWCIVRASLARLASAALLSSENKGRLTAKKKKKKAYKVKPTHHSDSLLEHLMVGWWNQHNYPMSLSQRAGSFSFCVQYINGLWDFFFLFFQRGWNYAQRLDSL